MAENRLHLRGSRVSARPCTRLLITLLLFWQGFPQASAQQAEPQTNAAQEQDPPAQNAINDRNTGAALSASERLANRARQALARAQAPPNPVWIEVSGKEVLGFWHEDASGNPEGAVLMLHDHGHSPRWPATLLNLHKTLPRSGWATLSIELPPPAPLAVPGRRAAVEETSAATQPTDEANAETDQQAQPDSATSAAQVDTAVDSESALEPSTPTAEEVELAVANTIDAALAYLGQQNQHNVVLMGEGLGAARALKFAGTVNNEAVRALVLVDARLPTIDNDELAELFNSASMPIMDLITSVDLSVRKRAAERQQAAKKARHGSYYLRRIMPQAGAPSPDKDIPLGKAIRGFITRTAPGKER